MCVGNSLQERLDDEDSGVTVEKLTVIAESGITAIGLMAGAVLGLSLSVSQDSSSVLNTGNVVLYFLFLFVVYCGFMYLKYQAMVYEPGDE